MAESALPHTNQPPSPVSLLARAGRRRAAPWKVAASLAVVSFSVSVATAFLSSSVPRNAVPNQRRVHRNVVKDADALLLDTIRSTQREKMEKLFHASPDEAIQELDAVCQRKGEPLLPPEDKKVGKNARRRRRVAMKKLPLSTTSVTKNSRSSTMPGFVSKADHEKRHRKDAPGNRKKKRKTYGETLYKNNPSVPDSLVQFAEALHKEDRISRKEEIELGEKTQEAIRLQNLYDVLEQKLNREPTDAEWCAAAGKINMEAIGQTIEEGIEAKNKLVTSNLRMVQSVVNTYLRNGLSTQYNAGDLMQEGILALIRAAEKFEPERGWKFSTYAMYWVRASVKSSQIYQSRVISVPQRLHENYKRLKRIEREIFISTGRMPTKKELGEAVGMSEQQVERCLTAMEQRCFSLDKEISNTRKPMSGSDSSGETLVEIVESKCIDSDYHQLQRVMLREDLIETLNRYLTPEEVDLLLLRYGLKEPPMASRKTLNGGQQITIAELSRMFGLKPDKVRRMINNSLKHLEGAGLEEFLAFDRELQ